ncbi:hypothetical protein GOP47_0008376 [Adiantum capillus-veneris]|uniref:X8 domain-containing protein n=1 Tax=Adiantum capillus-veneris TaxID=13818 RepID=A0A9D4UYP5_ADICA|nr:hypothetical protein GOP47_0008376 [Adiantum capillus-veneris]
MGVKCLAMIVGRGHPCHTPDTLLAHTSWAVNAFYFQKLGQCDFEGAATIVQQDPSSGSCVYPRTT